MKVGKRYLMLIILLLLGIGVHVFSKSTHLVETLYSTGFYRLYAAFLRYVFGWIPFSVGDLFYLLFLIWLIWRMIRRVNRYRRKSTFATMRSRGSLLYTLMLMLCAVYLFFNISWGLNYNRKGIATQLDLQIDSYSIADLKEMNCALQEKVIRTKEALIRQRSEYPGNSALFDRVRASYDLATKKYPFLAYAPTSLKSSMWGWLGSYMGFTGYYNPFTGEAQVNTQVPEFLQPFIACHEAAHQVGYAKEQEASFVGYLAASTSPDTLFQYSVYLDLFVYANRNLFRSDSVSAKLYANELSRAVLADLAEWKAFNRRHKSWLEPIYRSFYGLFLRSNQQPEGLMSYDEVTGFMIAFYKKFGRI